MSAITRAAETDPCPLSEGDEFFEGPTRLTILKVYESGERWFVRVESEHPATGVTRYSIHRPEARARVRDGRWSRLSR